MVIFNITNNSSSGCTDQVDPVGIGSLPSSSTVGPKSNTNHHYPSTGSRTREAWRGHRHTSNGSSRGWCIWSHEIHTTFYANQGLYSQLMVCLKTRTQKYRGYSYIVLLFICRPSIIFIYKHNEKPIAEVRPLAKNMFGQSRFPTGYLNCVRSSVDE